MSINADTTLKRLVKQVEIWAEAHDMINKFGYGDFLELMSESENRYPYFMVNIVNAGQSAWYIKYRVEIAVSDWVYDNDSNDTPAESSTLEITNDFIETVRYSRRWQAFSKVNGDPQLRKFKDRGKDKPYGWSTSIELWVKKSHGICDIESLLPTYDFGDETGGIICKSATLNTNGVFFREILSGATYNLPILDENTLLPVGAPNIGFTAFLVPSGGAGNINVTLNAILMRTVSANVVIPILRFGTTDTLGAGLFNGSWFISVQGSDSLEKGTVALGVVNISDSEIQVNGIKLTDVISEALLNILFKNTANTPINNIIGGELIAPDGSVQLFESDGITPIRTISSPSNVTTPEVLALATVNIFDSTGITLLYAVTVEAEGINEQNISDSNFKIFKSDGISLLHDIDSKAEEDKTQNIADSQLQLNGVNTITILATDLYNIIVLNSALTPIGVYNIPNDRIDILDTNYQVFDSTGITSLSLEAVISGVPGSFNVPNSQLQLNGVNTTSLLATLLYNNVTVDSALNPIGTYNVGQDRTDIGDAANTFNGNPIEGALPEATKAIIVENDAAIPLSVGIIDTDTKGLIKIIVPEAGGGGASLPYRPITGQRSSIATSGGDDGDDAVNGFFDDDFKGDYFNLVDPNRAWPQHNKRFTGVNGGYKDELTGNWFDVDGVASSLAAELPNDWYYDHLHDIQMYRFRTGNMNWQTGIDFVLAATVGGVTGLRNATKADWNGLIYDGSLFTSNNHIDTDVFNFSTSNMWSVTYNLKLTTQSYAVTLSTGQVAPSAQTGSRAFMYVKNF